MKIWIALIAVLFTLDQLRSAQCKTACGYMGYDDGFYKENACWCVDVRDFDGATNRKIILLPKKKDKQKQESGLDFQRS